MSELICRSLRDGALEGEHAPALTIKDRTASPFGFEAFSHFLSNLSSSILSSKSQSQAVVIVACTRNASFYLELLKKRGLDVTSSHKWIRILDCYTDPLGWKRRLAGSGNVSDEASYGMDCVCSDARDLDKLYSLIMELGKGIVGSGEVRFSVAIDSVNELLRHASTSTVAGLLSNLRSNNQISSIFWLFHSDLQEVRVTSVLEYLSSMVATVQPLSHTANGQRGDVDYPPLLEHSFGKGKFQVRFKRRNGRVREMWEEFHVERSEIKFTSVSSEDEIINQGLLPKVQFNLQLSEKERLERANVVLPFEHQGNGKPIQIYDGRRSLSENRNHETVASTGNSQKREDSGKGEIIYYRDSDDEMPDSDEDPDDDLDI